MVEGEDSDAGPYGGRRCIDRPHDQTIGSSEFRHKRAVLRGEGADNPFAGSSPMRNRPHIVLAWTVGFDCVTEHRVLCRLCGGKTQ